MRVSPPFPASLQEAAGETGFPGHYIVFVVLYRQMDLPVFTHMALTGTLIRQTAVLGLLWHSRNKYLGNALNNML